MKNKTKHATAVMTQLAVLEPNFQDTKDEMYRCPASHGNKILHIFNHNVYCRNRNIFKHWTSQFLACSADLNMGTISSL